MPPQINPQFSNSTPPILNPNKKSPKFILIAISILMIAGAYILYKYITTPMFPNPNQESPGTIQERDEMSDWKTYRNEEYGFEFKYPKDFEVTVTPTNIIEISENSGERAYPGIWIESNPNPNSLSLMGWWQKTPGDHSQEQIENIKVNNINVLKIRLPEGIGEDHYLLSYNQQVIDILRIGLNDKVVDQILSTFRFISTSTPVVDTTNWKIYRNTKYNYEFQYPNNWEVKSAYSFKSLYETDNVYAFWEGEELSGGGVGIEVIADISYYDQNERIQAKEKRILNGLEWNILNLKNNDPNSKYSKVAFTIRKNELVHISSMTNEDYIPYNDQFENILYTFKFTK